LITVLISIFTLASLSSVLGLNINNIGNEGLKDDRITIEPAEPNGDFEWYVTPVYVTFRAEDDIRLAYIYHKVITEGMEEPDWSEVDIREEETALYDLTITIDFDGIHTAHFYAVDHEDNVGPVHSSERIKIDTTSPTITKIQKEKIRLGQIKFIAVANDDMSDIYRIQFYLDNEPVGEDTQEPYEWLYELIDWINKGIRHTVTAEAYDYAGNSASKSASTPIIYSRINHLFHDALIIRFLEKIL
jgi:hypothetical protein